MKKIYLILILILTVSTTQAQRKGQTIKWFSLAAKGGIGNSFFLNTDILNDKNISPDYFTIGYSYGGRFTFSYGENIGFGIEYLMSDIGQDYGIVADAVTYTKSVNLKTSEIIPFFRYTGYGGGYFEIGPKFSTIKSVNETNSIDSHFTIYPDPMMNYITKFKSIMIGTGMATMKTERLEMNLGIRAAYSFTSITNDNYYVANDGVYIPAYTIPTKPTNPVSLQFVVELNYFFAFYGDASCGRGRLMFFQ